MSVNRLFGLLVLTVAMVVIVIAVRHEAADATRLTADELWPLAGKLGLVFVIGTAAYLMVYGRLQDALRAATFWLFAASLIGLGYTYRYELVSVADRVLAEVWPGHTLRLSGAASFEVTRMPGGDFAVRAAVNGRQVPMVVDTGASSVVLTVEAAKSAGLPLDFLRYDVVVETANGKTRAAAITVETLTVGNIVARRVPALVAERGVLKTSLLGMSFLNRLESYEVRGNRLVMRARPAG